MSSNELWEFKQIKSYVETIQKKYEEMEIKVQELKDVKTGKIQKFLEYPKTSYYGELDKLNEELLLSIEKNGNEIKIKNKEIAEANNIILKNAIDYFTNLGLTKEVYIFSGTSSKKKSQMACWLEDLNKQIPTQDRDCYNFENNLRSLKEKYKELLQAKEQIEKNKLKAQEEEIKKNEKFQLFIKLVKELNIDANKLTSNEDENFDIILEIMLNKNKYLKLAYYLHKNRLDWNEGYTYAETGLRGFKVETDTDKAIVKNIMNEIENWQGDGRCFRDCVWTYAKLFNLVSEEDNTLLELYNELSNFHYSYW